MSDFSSLQPAAVRPDNVPDAETQRVECKTCGGSGHFDVEAKLYGANPHSASRHACDDCGGNGGWSVSAGQYYPRPWRFVEDYSMGASGFCPALLDANGLIICTFFWPCHPAAETDAAVHSVVMLGEAIADFGTPLPELPASHQASSGGAEAIADCETNQSSKTPSVGSVGR